MSAPSLLLEEDHPATIMGVPVGRALVLAFLFGVTWATLGMTIANKADKREVEALRDQHAAVLWLLCKNDTTGDSVCRDVRRPSAP